MNNDPTKLNDFVAAANEKINEGLRDLYTTKGRMDALAGIGESQVSRLQETITALNGQIAAQGEALTHITRMLFGDSRTTQSPSIRKDIDRHDLELTEVRDEIRQLTELSKEILVAVGKLTDEIAALKLQIKPIVYVFTLIRNIPRFTWDKFKDITSNRWVRILVPVGAAALAILIEYLRSIGVIP